jgi:phosphoglycolate phosphatase
MESKNKIILFDFDGVIADSFSIGFEVNKILDPDLTDESFRNLFNGNINGYPETTHFTKEEIEGLKKRFFDEYLPRIKNVKIFPGMKEIILKLKENHVLLIVSSTIMSPIHDFLERNGIRSCFRIMGSKLVDSNKTDRIKRVFKDYNVEPEDCVFVTDTLGDIKEAASVGVRSIGVSWGFQEKDNLLRGNPVFIAESPKELLNGIEEYFN